MPFFSEGVSGTVMNVIGSSASGKSSCRSRETSCGDEEVEKLLAGLDWTLLEPVIVMRQ